MSLVGSIVVMFSGCMKQSWSAGDYSEGEVERSDDLLDVLVDVCDLAGQQQASG